MITADLLKTIKDIRPLLDTLAKARVDDIDDAKLEKELAKQQKSANTLSFELKQFEDSLLESASPMGEMVEGEDVTKASSRFASVVKTAELFRVKSQDK